MSRSLRFAIAGLLLPVPLWAQPAAWTLPAALGTVVRESGAHPAAPDYVLIQDVHAHGDVQTQIADLLRYARTRWGVDKAFIEGAFTPVARHDIPAAFLDPEAWRLLAKNGQLSGPELALLEAPAAFQLIGIDDPALYRDDIRAYEQLRQWRAQILRNHPTLSPSEKNLFNHLLSLQMTADDVAAYKTSKPLNRLSDSWARAAYTAEHFYTAADQRSAAFLANAEAVPSQGPRVLVTGGYHTEALCAALKAAGKSFMVIRPTVTRGGFEATYQDHLQQTARLLQSQSVVASKSL